MNRSTEKQRWFEDETYEAQLLDALREVDEIRHKMKALILVSPAMQKLVDKLKKPCMVAYYKGATKR